MAVGSDSELLLAVERLRSRCDALAAAYRSTVVALSNAVDERDPYTRKHAERVAAYGLVIAREAGLELEPGDGLEFGFLLHDIGKIAIPDSILFKPEGLTEQERAVIEGHPAIGSAIIESVDFLADDVVVVRSHHERWDGTGYPDRLAGEEIPFAARVFAVGDVFDALTTRRPYRMPSPLPEARAMIRAAAGSHFDPEVVEAFNRIPDATFARIRSEIA